MNDLATAHYHKIMTLKARLKKRDDEIERLRGALREISTRNFPEGTATLELRKIARSALGEKE